MAESSRLPPTRLPRFGTDGVRGVANVDLTPDVAIALARASAAVLGGDQNDSVVIGRDTRQSGPMLEAALVAGFTASGINVELLGVVPTPAVAFASVEANCSGVMISASHNPFADNGIKLFAPGGAKLGNDTEGMIQAAMHELLTGAAAPDASHGASLGSVESRGDSDAWVQRVVSSVDSLALANFSLVLDCANGSATSLGPEIFRRLGAKVSVIGASPDGVNINLDVGSTSPSALQAEVQAVGADAGLAFDGDADRLIAVDHTGAIVDGDHILAILAKDWKASGRLHQNTVVVTVMSNFGFGLAMEAAGISVVETNVGDRYVLEALKRGAAGRHFSLGGEQSGHVICRDLATTGDGVLAGVQLLDAVRRSGGPLHALASSAMTTYPQILRNVRLKHQDPNVADSLADVVGEAETELGDQGRVLVRPSGTEPLVRIMVEHRDAETADRVCSRLVEVAAQRVGL